MRQKKTFSTIAALSIAGLTATLFFISSEPSNSQKNSSEMMQMEIPESLKTWFLGSTESLPSENIQKEDMKLSPCSIASVIIGKNGIAKCSP